ncbi:MAG: hypothetical protein HKN86_06525 [Acidimicrobiia bacterium]|nr:hypothetical protein [Acidimicrobiia bacterium]
MGQYFITINKTKKEYIDTYTFGDGAKFLEFMSSDMGMKEATMMLLTNGGVKDNYLGHWSSDSIEVLGDYAEEGNLWDEIQDKKTKWKNISIPVYKALFEHNAWFKEKMDKRLRKHPHTYLYTDQKKVLTEVFPEAMMEGKLREKYDFVEKEAKVFTFDDLVFKPHRIGAGHVQAKHTFKNGNSVSVVGGELLNGNGVDTWEIGIIDEKNDVMETIDFADKDIINVVLQKQQSL